MVLAPFVFLITYHVVSNRSILLFPRDWVWSIPAGQITGELPFEGGSVADEAAASTDFLSQNPQIRNSTPSQALTAGQADFDFRLAEPAAMFGRVPTSGWRWSSSIWPWC